MSRREQQHVRLTPAEYREAVRRYRVCVDLICALPGCPTIYYSDEAGLTGCADPFCRMPFPWGHEDRELQAYVGERLNHHRRSAVLKTGLCQVEAPDDDTIRIRRYMQDGRDAFGNRSAAVREEVFIIRR